MPRAQELLVRRTWSVAEHPQWLVLEAEGQLQIRPQQHWLAVHLMSNPGSIEWVWGRGVRENALCGRGGIGAEELSDRND